MVHDTAPIATIAAGIGLAFVLGFGAVRVRLPPLVGYLRTGSRELFTLSVLAVALGIAVGASALFGVSFALGAFFAGTVVNGSELSHEAAAEALSLQDAFSVLFFVAVGMLFDPSMLMERPLRRTGRRRDCDDRKVHCRVLHRPGLSVRGRHGADDLGQPGSDW